MPVKKGKKLFLLQNRQKCEITLNKREYIYIYIYISVRISVKYKLQIFKNMDTNTITAKQILSHEARYM